LRNIREILRSKYEFGTEWNFIKVNTIVCQWVHGGGIVKGWVWEGRRCTLY